MEKRILIPNAAKLIESMRSIGYSFETAIADIIDNSIYAECNNIQINFNAFVKEPYLLIFDDGFGMDELELENAMIYGTKNPNECREQGDLGRFGLGLKSASLSQCREMIVISKKHILNAYSWDLDYVIETNEWAVKKYSSQEIDKLNLPEIEELKKMDSGTIVLWKRFDRFSDIREKFEDEFLKKIEILECHIALVFHRFLNKKEGHIKIFLNKSEILPVDPFLTNNMSTQPKPTQTMDIYGEKVVVKPYILPHINKISIDEMASLGGKEKLRSSQGYYIYRNKRLIIWGQWFGQYPKNELQKLVRVKVDIPNSLDKIWEIDIKKSAAVLPFVIKKNLGLTINRALEDGKRVFHFRGRKKNDQLKIEYIWDRIVDRGRISYKVNRNHPVLKDFFDRIGNNVNMEQFLMLLEDYLPIQQLYNDHAENKNILNIENNTNTLEKARLILSCFTLEQRKEIINNPLKIEGLNLELEDLNVLRKEIDNE